jgi:SpoVK/Ycf46/Vps4 family AAA+-type ATPase
MAQIEDRISQLEQQLADAKKAAVKLTKNPLPSWAQELGERYRGGTISEFLITGNISDVVPMIDREGGISFVGIRRFLAEMLFARRDAVIFFDPAGGITFEKTETYGDFHRVAEAVDAASGTHFAKGLPRDPRRALYLIERYIRARIDGRGNQRPKSIAVVIDYTQLICPEGPVNQLSFEEQATLVTLLRWASEPLYLKADLTIILIAENLAEVNGLLVKSPYVGKINVELPNIAERLVFLGSRFKETPVLNELSDVEVPQFAELTAGLSRINLQHVLSQAVANHQKVTQSFINESKKELIEKECYGLLEFLTPKWKLDMVSGHDAAKNWLREDATLISQGRTDCLPMGYLLCGPVGTGKSFLVECYTGEIGIPCVKLKNFRSQWQGVTEGNWQKILAVLKATGPVGVIIDEADAAVGNRGSGGDGGTSSRIFSMLAAQMGDTRYRGRILWFLITCRPDLLPIDLKRQGRAEIHIPLFYPDSKEEREQLLRVMARKVNAKLDVLGHGNQKEEGEEGSLSVAQATDFFLDLSGADIEGVIIRSKRRAALEKHETVTEEDLRLELSSFIPPQYPNKVQLQIMSAVVECSDKRFLPKRYASLERDEILEQFAQLKIMVDGR